MSFTLGRTQAGFVAKGLKSLEGLMWTLARNHHRISPATGEPGRKYHPSTYPQDRKPECLESRSKNNREAAVAKDRVSFLSF